MESILHILQQEPLASFAVLLGVILFVPPLFERIRLPGLVGLLVAGVILGPNGLGWLQEKSQAMKLLSDIGLVYLMFVAGLEIDLEQFNKTKHRSIGFGSLTFLVPLITGTIVGRVFGFGWNGAILIGSLFASHTLLAYPIVSRLGVVGNEAVTVTIGATIFTDIGALLVLAVCMGIHAGDFSPMKLVGLIGSLAVYTVIVLFGFDRAGREFFRRSGDQEGNQFLFVLLAVFLAAVGAQIIGIEKIVGAFLAGLAVNGALGHGAVKEKVMFVGSVLFIPIFFVNMGLLINVPVFIRSLTTPQTLGLTLAIVGGLIFSKFMASLLAALAYRYNRREMLVMWSLSMPQVAATLAATLVGFRANLLTEDILNSVIVLMLVTSTLGPIITSRYAPELTVTPELDPEGVIGSLNWDQAEERFFTVVVPVHNPKTERYLIELAALLVRNYPGRIVPLSVATGHTHMNDPQITAALRRSQALLAAAVEVSREVGVEAEPLIRIDDSIAQGINRASREQNASLVVMGWGRRTGLQARLFGSVIDSVLWGSHCPVAISRLLESPTKVQRILVPLENMTPRSLWITRFAHVLAESIQAKVTLLHVSEPTVASPFSRSGEGKIAWTRAQLELMATKVSPNSMPQIQIQSDEDVVKAIAAAANEHDLVILCSSHRRTSAGGLAVSDVTSQITERLTCSIIMLGEPYTGTSSSLLGTNKAKTTQ
ncbi:cation:proton antiporter [Leptothermofonsia sichuanensis E412]|uniref:cation:proton antiporter domain-containing protein n=1 Tax=Leptothermofonsia sichuanensis TaxID=2917832 RepID=UPI001CA65DE0|nr:cation:proton antiporter [Leptothermofonsia sichuanensis]QZZ22737.1 cation:proton antiporter [Leptothermofonsia sichuanensis E412]